MRREKLFSLWSIIFVNSGLHNHSSLLPDSKRKERTSIQIRAKFPRITAKKQKVSGGWSEYELCTVKWRHG
jgi:hypothetical protein